MEHLTLHYLFLVVEVVAVYETAAFGGVSVQIHIHLYSTLIAYLLWYTSLGR